MARGCAIAAAVLFVALAAFQVALAAGVPWGRAAWGGGQAELGTGLRAASGVQAVLAGGVALVVLRRAGRRVWSPLPRRWLPAAGWVLAAAMALGTLLNALSRSPIERAVWTLTALSLAVLCAVVAARSPTAQAHQTKREARRARRDELGQRAAQGRNRPRRRAG